MYVSVQVLGAWGLRAADTTIAMMKDATPASDPYTVVTLLMPQKNKKRAADIMAKKVGIHGPLSITLCQ